MGELGALFNPGMRHEIEERESKANRREEEGNARDGDIRIDLASGVAVINIAGKASNNPAKSNEAAGNAKSEGSDAAAGQPDRDTVRAAVPTPVTGTSPATDTAPATGSASNRPATAPAAPATASAANRTSATRRSNSGSTGRAARSNETRANSTSKSGGANRSDDSTQAAPAPRPASKASRAAR